MTYTRILLASHGTPGAQAAEALALSLAMAGGTLHHLLVVPDFWQGMMGDDWLNNVRTRIQFGEYLESQLAQEAMEHLDRLAQATRARGLDYRPQVRQGEPTEVLIRHTQETACELIVIGAPRPKNQAGLRSRVRLDTLARALTVPLLVAAYPHA